MKLSPTQAEVLEKLAKGQQLQVASCYTGLIFLVPSLQAVRLIDLWTLRELEFLKEVYYGAKGTFYTISAAGRRMLKGKE